MYHMAFSLAEVTLSLAFVTEMPSILKHSVPYTMVSRYKIYKLILDMIRPDAVDIIH